MTEALLVGNNLAVLVAAAQLGEAGHDVVLLTDGRPPGGHFRGMRLEDADFDIGMVLLELLPGADDDADRADYRPGVRYDWTRFGGHVDRWLATHVPRVRTPTPEVLVDGRRWPDYLIANRLDVLAGDAFPPPPLVPREDPRHAAAKIDSPAFATLRYAEAAELNHGTVIQRRLVAPFAAKLLGQAGEDLLARYHRAGWLPLYWPETLGAACEGRPTGLAEYPFWTTATGFVGELVRSLERRLSRLPNVVVSQAQVAGLRTDERGWEVRGGDGEQWTHPRPVLGLAQERLRELLALPAVEKPSGASVLLVCCLVRSSAIGSPVGCLSVVDPEIATYRITDQDVLAGLDPAWHRVVVEAGPEVVARRAAGEEVTGSLVAEMCRLLAVPAPEPGVGVATGNDVRVLRTMSASNAIAVPTRTTVAAEEAALGELAAACGRAVLTGALLGVGATSMNDQIVQGLAAARQLG